MSRTFSISFSPLKRGFCLAGDPADVRWPRGLRRLCLRARAPARRSMLCVRFICFLFTYSPSQRQYQHVKIPVYNDY